MSQFQNHLCCPHCKKWANHISNGSAEIEKKQTVYKPTRDESETVKQLFARAPSGYVRERECEECGAIWTSIELPLDFVQVLAKVTATSAPVSDALKSLANWNSQEPRYYCLNE